MIGRTKWAIITAFIFIIPMVIISCPVAACFSQTTSCEGESVYQGDGGATDYWYDDLYPPEHTLNAGDSTEWVINVKGSNVCSQWEECEVTDNTPPVDWTTEIIMGDIYTGSFHYIEPGNPPVYKGDDIEGRVIYLGGNWDFDVIYRITAPGGAAGGSAADMICGVYVVGYDPENQHDYVYVHCEALVDANDLPIVVVNEPNGGETLNGWSNITWDGTSPIGLPLTFDVLCSADSGVTYPYTLVSGISDPFWDWDTTTYPDDITYRVKVIAFDGTNYGSDTSDGDFALDNYAPNPPTNLVIHLGLTTNGEPTAKGPEDTTDIDLERIQKDDARGYSVLKGKTLSIETFNTTIQNDPVESAMLCVKYWVENTDYSGTNSVAWKLETEAGWINSGITPKNTEILPVVRTFDLFVNGVDTINEIANLDVAFHNDDGGESQAVNFDYIWVTFKASTNDIGLTWESSPSPDIDHYHIYRSSDDVSYSLVGETSGLLWNDAGKAVDLNNYFYRIYGVDTGAKESLPTYTVVKYVVPLSTDWNMVSTPLIQQLGGSLSSALQSIDSYYNIVISYQAGYSKPWLTWHLSKPSGLNSLTVIENIYGYHINMKTAENFITIGRLPTNEVIPLKAGWNLIGYPSLSSQIRDDALSSISGEYNAVYRFDPTIQREVEVLVSDNMMPGNAYWLHVSHDCDLFI